MPSKRTFIQIAIDAIDGATVQEAKVIQETVNALVNKKVSGSATKTTATPKPRATRSRAAEIGSSSVTIAPAA